MNIVNFLECKKKQREKREEFSNGPCQVPDPTSSRPCVYESDPTFFLFIKRVYNMLSTLYVLKNNCDIW
jgi:hypothetical protein